MMTALLLAAAVPAQVGRDREPGSGLVSVLVLDRATGQATLVNHALRPLGVGRCEPAVESLREGGWVPLDEPESPGCDAEVHYLMPGDSGTLSFHCPAGPGTYRLRVDLVLEREALEPLETEERSPAFQVTGSGAPGPCSAAQAL